MLVLSTCLSPLLQVNSNSYVDKLDDMTGEEMTFKAGTELYIRISAPLWVENVEQPRVALVPCPWEVLGVIRKLPSQIVVFTEYQTYLLLILF